MNNLSENNTNESLNIALINEVTSNNLKDVLVDGAEFTLDHFLEEGVLKEIPFFGTLYKSWKAAKSIRESIFAKKVFKLLIELKDVPQKERESFINRLENSKEYKQKVGEKLLVLIDQLDDMEKPQIVGRLLKVAIQGKISYEIFLLLLAIVQRVFLPDLLKLKTSSFEKVDPLMKERFASLGIVSTEINDKGRKIEKISSEGYASSIEYLPTINYKLNKVGESLIEYGLN